MQVGLRRLLIALGALLVLGCSWDVVAPQPPRLVVLYATCSLNKQFLSPYDPTVEFTPAIEGFAQEAVVFERHQTESGQSGTAFASIFTGTQADRHGIFRHPRYMPTDRLLLTEAFAAEGYAVHTWLDHPMASAALGYARGATSQNRRRRKPLADDPEFLALLDALGSDPKARALVVTNFAVTHGPYRAQGLARLCREHPSRCGVTVEPGFRALRRHYNRNNLPLSYDFEATVERLGITDAGKLLRVVELLYAASVVDLDERFGRVLEAIDARGMRDESLVVFTSDHGEIQVRENAAFRWTHGFMLAPEVLNVPLLIRAPGLNPARYEAVTRSIDVFPTLAGLAGLTLDTSAVDGVDLSAALRGDEPPPELVAMSHTALIPGYFWMRWEERLMPLHPGMGVEWMWVGARRSDLFHEFRHTGGGEFGHAVFDLAADPQKRTDLFDAGNPDHRAMAERLVAYKETLANAQKKGIAGSVEDQRRLELLREIGYIE